MARKELYAFVIDYFQRVLPDAETELDYRNPYELLVAVILSAQCTDKRVNMTTPALFAAYPTAKELSEASYDDVFAYIKSISYPGNKSRHLLGMAKMLVEQYNGQVPEDWDELIKLPGVGRKTANVVASVVFDKATMPVDTHVFRVSQRIGLVTRSKTPLQVEKQLMKNVPEELVGKFHHWLILHGRYVCIARRPLCENCGLPPVCKYFNTVIKKQMESSGN
jgi:endonuclease-3